ncbi:MAG: hypothetical protein F4Z66_06310, partial [Gammaproteobacteria bacterium]|nr:hypothetical protein [Gammaproteobacteria bacterium]
MQTLNPRKVVIFGTQRFSHRTRPFEEISEYPSWYRQLPYSQSQIEDQRLGDTYYGTSKTDDIYFPAIDLPGSNEMIAESRFSSPDQPVVYISGSYPLPSVHSSPSWQSEAQDSDELVQLKEDLKTVIDEATREGIDSPSSLAIENAEFMIDRMYRISPDEFMIELLPDSGIAVTRT